MTIFGTLTKITAGRKLMIKIDQAQHTSLSDRLLLEYSKHNFPTTAATRYATFELMNDDGQDNYFVMVSLDKYDQQLLERKFEPFLRQHVAIVFICKPYDFMTAESESKRICGVNIQSVRIRKFVPKEIPASDLTKEQKILKEFELTHCIEDAFIRADHEQSAASDDAPLVTPVLIRQ